MKSRWFWIAIIVIVVLLIIGFLYSQGIIKVRWQWLAIILGVLAAPFQLIASIFGQNKKIAQIMGQRETRIKNEQIHRQIYDAQLKEKDEKIRQLQNQVMKMQDQIEKLEMQKKEKEVEINNINDANKLQDLFTQAYEDEA